MQIKMISTTPVGGKIAIAGSVVDSSESDARFLIATGKAVAFTKPKAKAKAKTNRMVGNSEIKKRDSGD